MSSAEKTNRRGISAKIEPFEMVRVLDPETAVPELQRISDGIKWAFGDDFAPRPIDKSTHMSLVYPSGLHNAFHHCSRKVMGRDEFQERVKADSVAIEAQPSSELGPYRIVGQKNELSIVFDPRDFELDYTALQEFLQLNGSSRGILRRHRLPRIPIGTLAPKIAHDVTRGSFVDHLIVRTKMRERRNGSLDGVESYPTAIERRRQASPLFRTLGATVISL